MQYTRVTSGWMFNDVLPLLSESMGRLATLPDWQRRYLTDPGFHLWRAVQEGDCSAAILGLHRSDSHTAEITHMAVDPTQRHQGIGGRMMAYVQNQYPAVTRWWCETDDDAVGFYTALGWDIAPLGRPHPGWRPRYRAEIHTS